MPRKPRIEIPGAFYHVISHGNRKSSIFNDDEDRERFLEKLLHYKNRYHFILYAYTLMSNHFHLLIEMQDIPLSRIMQGLLQSHTQWYNRKYEMVGYLFQARYTSILCDRDAFALDLARYLHLHCVRAGLVKDPSDYRWSSHRAYLDIEESTLVDTCFILNQFSKNRRKAIQAYAKFVKEWLNKGSVKRFFEVADERILGEENFVRKIKKTIQEVINQADCFTKNRNLDEVAHIIHEQTGVNLDDMRSCKRKKSIADARGLFLRLALICTKCKRKEIATYLQKSPRSIPFLERRISDRKFDRFLRKVKQ